MVHLRARKSLIFLAGAALIAVALATTFALRQSYIQHVTDYMRESASAPEKEEVHVSMQRPAIEPKLSVRANAASPLIARTATIAILAGNVDRVIEQIGRLARSNNGVVFGLETQNDNAPDSTASADMSIRVPASRFDETIAALARLGAVTSRSVKAEDLTGDITDSSARLTNLRRTEADIRTIMDRAGSVSDIMDAETKLSDIREQIETIDSDLKSMAGRVVYSSIDIHLAAEAQNKPTDPSISAQLGNAFGNATHALVQSVVGLVVNLIWLVVFTPYAAIVLAAGWFIRLRLRKNAVGG